MEKYKQNIAVDMRKRGLSYSEIGNKLHIPKSTLSYWLKNLKLTPEQIKKLNDKRVEITKTNALKKISRTSKMIEEIKSSSSQDIKEISKKELWLMGVMLYWKNGNKSDLKKGVHFSSSDPYMIKLFLKWLKEAGGIKDGEIKFEIFLKNNGNDKNEFKEKAVNYWSDVTGFPKAILSRMGRRSRATTKWRIENGELRIK
jgi:predicted transcriptional regulator